MNISDMVELESKVEAYNDANIALSRKKTPGREKTVDETMAVLSSFDAGRCERLFAHGLNAEFLAKKLREKLQNKIDKWV